MVPLRVLLLFCCCNAIFPHSCFGADEEDESHSERQYHEHLVDADFLGASPYFVENFNLGEVSNNEWQRVSVAIKNHSNESFKLETVSLSCACTTASVPHEVVEVGEMKVATFIFPVENVRGSLDHDVSATIQCSGSVKRIGFTFKSRVTNVAKFAISPANFKISDDVGLVDSATDKGEAKFEIPLLVADMSILPKLKVEANGDLPLKFIDVISRDDKLFARVAIETLSVSPDGCYGELVLTSPYGQDRILGAVVREQMVAIKPSTLVFTKDTSGKESYSGGALARIKSDREKDNQIKAGILKEVEIVSSKSQDKKPEFRVEVSDLANGIYRLQFTTTLDSGKEYDLPKHLRLRVTTDQGVYPIDLKVRWGD